MILQKMPHYVDSILTQEDASAALQDGQVVVGLYTNRENVQSVVHSHPYYEMILPVAGSSVRYSVDGSVYDLHLGGADTVPGRDVPLRQVQHHGHDLGTARRADSSRHLGTCLGAKRPAAACLVGRSCHSGH